MAEEPPEDLYDILQRALKDPSTLPPPPIASFLGFRLVEYGPGIATMEIEIDGRFYNPLGTLHGGVLCDISDAAMGMAYASELGRGESFTTIELKINFMKPVWRGRLRAEGRVVKRGRTVGLTECDVFDEKRSLVARASSTCMTLRGEMAKGR
ncbi:MAG TPA: PaaI family thioesterase [Polyangia bacterium]|nr:PaaI family thioesterase [Polyangia bacterium]